MPSLSYKKKDKYRFDSLWNDNSEPPSEFKIQNLFKKHFSIGEPIEEYNLL